MGEIKVVVSEKQVELTQTVSEVIVGNGIDLDKVKGKLIGLRNAVIVDAEKRTSV